MSSSQELFNAYLQAVQSLSSEKDLYDFEEKFAKLHTEFGRQMLEKQLEKQEKKGGYKKNSRQDSGQSK